MISLKDKTPEVEVSAKQYYHIFSEFDGSCYGRKDTAAGKFYVRIVFCKKQITEYLKKSK